MHELPVTEGILRAVLPAAEKAGAKRIREIRLEIGELSGVEPACVQEYLDMISEGTPAEGAVIVAVMTPALIKCRSCAYEGPAGKTRSVCPNCSSEDFAVTGGWEVTVDSIAAE